MYFNRLFLVVHGLSHPAAFPLSEQETRIDSREFVARILEDGSVAVKPDGDGDELVVPHDGTVVTSNPGQLRLIYRFCVCHSEEEATRKIDEIVALRALRPPFR